MNFYITEKMGKAVLDAILNAMQVWLNEVEREQLYHELIAYFGLIGAINECQALKTAWQDPYNRKEIEHFIKAWLSRRRIHNWHYIALMGPESILAIVILIIALIFSYS